MWQIPPPTFRIAALSPARAPQADREMASPFTPGKRSGTKGAAGGITTRGRGEGCLKWCSSRMGGDIIYVGLTHTCISELSCIELSYLAVLCCPQAALSLLMDASLCPHDSLILD